MSEDPGGSGGSGEGNGGTTSSSGTTGANGGAGADGSAATSDSNAGGSGGSSGASGVSGGAGGSSGNSGTGGASGSSGAGGATGTSEPAPAVCGDGKVEGIEVCDGNCPTAATCEAVAGNACVKRTLTGDATKCDARCETTSITACVKGDGCCPDGCKYPADDDCSKSCGDGVVDAPEKCEPNSATQKCPTSCDDQQPSTKDMLTGSATQCSAECVHIPITAPMNGDGYCPAGANANNDNDCDPVCGNGVKEAGEDCDGSSCPTSCPRPTGYPCTVAEVQGSGCARKCVQRTLTANKNAADGCCPSTANANTDADCDPVCGNGVTESGESCDATCVSSCSSSDPCTKSERVGGACNWRCETSSRSPSLTRDSCCPTNNRAFNANTDADCTPRCGNGEIEAGEDCEGTSSTCSGCKKVEPPPTGYKYNTPCSGAPYSTCFNDTGRYVCHSNGMCTPTCNQQVDCPAAQSGHKVDCAILCQIYCIVSGDCPSGMTCIKTESGGVCGYHDVM